MWSQSRFVIVLTGLLFGFATFSAWVIAGWREDSPLTSQAGPFLTSNVNLINPDSKLPSPGSYELQKIFAVPNRTVLDPQGNEQPLGKYAKDKITLLTFFYQRCSDVDGCPYAMGLFHTVKNKLESLNAADGFRLVHISFDPERDTPMMMAGLQKQMTGEGHHQHEGHDHGGHGHEGHHASAQHAKGVEWNFLTTSSVNALLPLIEDFGQNVDVQLDPVTGQKTLTYQHVLKVFLIDPQGVVREIYSTPYLDAEVLFNDIQTLKHELAKGGN